MSRIEEIEAREQAATTGMWGKSLWDKTAIYRGSDLICKVTNENDMDFIAHAREDVSYLLGENERLTAELEKYRAAEQGGQLVVLPIGYMHGRITDQYAKYNLHSIHDICYAGFDGTCEMPHCSGCPIRKMYMIMQDIENQAEAVQKEREPQ